MIKNSLEDSQPSAFSASDAEVEKGTEAQLSVTPPKADDVDGFCDEDSDELSLSGWLWRLCIPVIPCVGILVYLIMLCFWSFSKNPAPSYFKTWAKAALIATLLQVAFIFVIILAVQLSGMDIIGLVTTFVKKLL